MKRALLLASAAALFGSVLVSHAQIPGVNSTLQTVFTLAYDQSTMKPTYSAVVSSFSPAASATDICALTGSATKNIRVRRITVGLWGTSVVTEPIGIITRSSIDSVGTGSTVTPVAYDSNSAVGTAVVETWTANPTIGTLIGNIADPFVSIPLAGTAAAQPSTTFTFGQLGQPLVLRGASQGVFVHLGGQTITGGTASCTFEWTEE